MKINIKDLIIIAGIFVSVKLLTLTRLNSIEMYIAFASMIFFVGIYLLDWIYAYRLNKQINFLESLPDYRVLIFTHIKIEDQNELKMIYFQALNKPSNNDKRLLFNNIFVDISHENFSIEKKHMYGWTYLYPILKDQNI